MLDAGGGAFGKGVHLLTVAMVVLRRQESLLLEPEGMLFPPQTEPKA